MRVVSLIQIFRL